MAAVLFRSIAVSFLLWAGCAPRTGGPGTGADAGGTGDGGAPPVGCREGERTCVGDTPSVCTADGTFTAEGPACPDVCIPGRGCVASDDPCSVAAAEGSYIGCEYWAVPLPNAPADHLFTLFDFRIVVANADSAPASITVTREGATVASVEVAPGSAEAIVLPWIPAVSRGIEHIGGGPSDPPPGWDSLTVPNGAYRVTSDRPVVVYQFNPFDYATDPTPDSLARYSYSNDASLLLPVHALGTRYRGLAHQPQSMQWSDPRIAGPMVNAHPGYLAVLGTADAPTEVTVVPTAPVAAAADGRFGAAAAGETLRFSVARGEVVVLAAPPPPHCDSTRPGYRYVEPSATGLLADEFCNETDYDLTGSRIDASAPIAVFGGHACAFVPYDAWACDHLEEQLPPATTLGREIVIAPLVDTILPAAPDAVLVRVIGVIDGTTVALDPPVDGVAELRLDDGDVRELLVREPHHLSASEGVLVAEYLAGQLADGVESEAQRGDPAMIVVPPVEQFRDEYLFITPTSYDDPPAFPGDSVGQSFIVVTRPIGAEVRLDGEPLEGTFRAVGAHEVGTFPIRGGSHRLESDGARFGLLVFGLGKHTSYAYPGGLDLEPILLI